MDIYFPNSKRIKAKFVRILKEGECDCIYDELYNYHIQGKNVYINMTYMVYPNLQKIELASHQTICEWYRFLPSPENDSQEKLMKRICDIFKEKGGFTAEISKIVGFSKR